MNAHPPDSQRKMNLQSSHCNYNGYHPLSPLNQLSHVMMSCTMAIDLACIMEWLGVLTSGFDGFGLPCFAMLCHVNVGKSRGMSPFFCVFKVFRKILSLDACVLHVISEYHAFHYSFANRLNLRCFRRRQKYVEIESIWKYSISTWICSTLPCSQRSFSTGRAVMRFIQFHWNLADGAFRLSQYGSIWINILRKPLVSLIGIGTRMWILSIELEGTGNKMKKTSVVFKKPSTSTIFDNPRYPVLIGSDRFLLLVCLHVMAGAGFLQLEQPSDPPEPKPWDTSRKLRNTTGITGPLPW